MRVGRAVIRRAGRRLDRLLVDGGVNAGLGRRLHRAGGYEYCQGTCGKPFAANEEIRYDFSHDRFLFDCFGLSRPARIAQDAAPDDKLLLDVNANYKYWNLNRALELG